MNPPSPTRRFPTARTLTASLLLSGVVVGSLVAAASASAQGAPAPAAAAAPAAPAAPAGDPVGNAERGMRKAATCLGCHAVPDYKADFPTVYRVPMLGGQNAKYIENALKEYQKGERRFPSMVATAKSLSDQDIADLAAYFSSQR
jgi:cytochrome c553